MSILFGSLGAAVPMTLLALFQAMIQFLGVGWPLWPRKFGLGSGLEPSGGGGYAQGDSFSVDGAEDETMRDEKPLLTDASSSRTHACALQGNLVDAMDATSGGSALKGPRVDLI
ncbi:hypothetical protein R3P38DRAFT_2813301 [Favolaschia claudopus]|uniref:Uncharacterized protein n=1 Tax=Favolaschia claudopus TaxID=2862362 RepID=A0AAV9Z3V8_9AGAR